MKISRRRILCILVFLLFACYEHRKNEAIGDWFGQSGRSNEKNVTCGHYERAPGTGSVLPDKRFVTTCVPKKDQSTIMINAMSNETETSKIFVPADSIEYAANSVVSKTIVKRPAGSITLFAFDKGEGLSEHSSPHEAIVQILDGQAEISIAGNAADLVSGQCIILPANIPHALKANEKFKMMLTMIKN